MKTVTYPIAPAITPLKGTLLDAATVDPGIANLPEVGLFDTYNCLKFEGEAEFCAPSPKDFVDGITWVDGFRFAAYGGIKCKAIGLDESRMLAEVRKAFEAGESTAVERAFMKTRFVDDGSVDDKWDAPVDINPAGAVSPAVGLALLESYAAANYVGAPVLHVPIVIASLVMGVDGAVYDGNVLRTKFGSKIAAGAGYDFPNTGPTGAAAAAGERWLYATGNVLIRRGEPEIRQAMSTDTNEVFVLAERPYIAAVDCFTAAIRVTVE